LLLFNRRSNHVIKERGRDKHCAIPIDHDYVVWKYRNATAVDRFLPTDEGQAGHGWRRCCALTPDWKAGIQHARNIPDHTVCDKGCHSALVHPCAENVAEDSGIGDAQCAYYGNTATWHCFNRSAG
jgi:hypothetical protein